MKKQLFLVLVLLATLQTTANGQHWQYGEHYSDVPMQFISPTHIRTAYTQLNAVIEGTDDTVMPPSRKWHTISTFRNIDSTTHYPSGFQIDGLYFIEPNVGFVFGSHGAYDPAGSWIAVTTDGKTWQTVIDNNDSQYCCPLTNVGTDLYFFKGPNAHYGHYSNPIGQLTELDVLHTASMTIERSYVFSGLRLGKVSLVAFAMRTDNHGLIAILDSNNTTHIFHNAGSRNWYEVESFDTSKDLLQFLKVDSAGNFWCGRKGGLYSSSNEGASWKLRFALSDVIHDMAFGTSKVAIATVRTKDYLLKTLDSGKHWFRLHFANAAGFHVTGFDSLNFAMANNYGYWETTDGGGAPKGFLHFDSDQYSMGVNKFQDTAHRFVTAYNYGADTLRIFGVNSTNNWASISPSKFDIGPGDSLTLTVNYFTGAPALDLSTFDFISVTADTAHLSVQNLSNVASIEHRAYFNHDPVRGVDSSFLGIIHLIVDGGGKLRIQKMSWLRDGLNIDSSGNAIQGTYGRYFMPLYGRVPQGRSGADSAQIVVVSNSINSPDTIMAYWNVRVPAAITGTTGVASPMFSLWPNPASSEIKLLPRTKLSVRVIDVLGRIQQEFETVPDRPYTFSLPAGSYRVIATDSRNEKYGASLIVR